MNGRVIAINDISANDELLWRDLAKNAEEPNPLFEADCMIPAARFLPYGDQMLLVIAEEEGRFFGCFPIIRKAGVETLIANLPGLRRPVITTHVRRNRYDGTPLMRKERGVEAAVALLSVLKEQAQGSDAGILVFEAMRDEGPVSRHFRISAKILKLPIRTYRTYQRPVVYRRDDSTYQNIHGRETHRTNEKKRRRLGKMLGGEVQGADRSLEPSAVDELLVLEAAGYKLKRDLAVESHPGEFEWFRDMCDRFREANRLHLYSLQVGETVAAMQLLVRGGEGLFSLVASYDEDQAKYSPGIQLYLEVINRFHDSTDAQWLDSCTYAGNGTFLWAYPDLRTVSTFLIPLRGSVDRFYVRIYMLFIFMWNMLGPDSTFRSKHRRLIAPLIWIFSRWQRSPSEIVRQ